MILFNRYLVAGAALAAFTAGWAINGWRLEAREADALRADIEDYKLAEEKGRKHAEALEAKLSELDTTNRDLSRRIAHETRNDSYRCKLPTHGVRLLGEARANADTPGKPHGKVP